MKPKNLIITLTVTGLILLVPLMLAQKSDGVNWTLMDFIIAGSLIFGTSLTYQLATRKVRDNKRKFFIGTAIFLVLCAVWVLLATGLPI